MYKDFSKKVMVSVDERKGGSKPQFLGRDYPVPKTSAMGGPDLFKGEEASAADTEKG